MSFQIHKSRYNYNNEYNDETKCLGRRRKNCLINAEPKHLQFKFIQQYFKEDWDTSFPGTGVALLISASWNFTFDTEKAWCPYCQIHYRLTLPFTLLYHGQTSIIIIIITFQYVLEIPGCALTNLFPLFRPSPKLQSGCIFGGGRGGRGGGVYGKRGQYKKFHSVSTRCQIPRASVHPNESLFI